MAKSSRKSAPNSIKEEKENNPLIINEDLKPRLFGLEKKLLRHCAMGHVGCNVCNLKSIESCQKPKKHEKNINSIQKELEKNRKLDVVFLGDSITAGWTGVGKGAFERNFNREKGAKFNGLALGIGGDLIEDLYYRVTHGEVPEELNPSMWWVTIGRNNERVKKCFGSNLAFSILQVVEEIRIRKPNSIIVVNGILPSALYRKDKTWKNLSDANRGLGLNIKWEDNIYFVNTSEHFLETKENANKLLYSDRIHLNADGYEQWSKAIVNNMDELIMTAR